MMADSLLRQRPETQHFEHFAPPQAFIITITLTLTPLSSILTYSPWVGGWVGGWAGGFPHAPSLTLSLIHTFIHSFSHSLTLIHSHSHLTLTITFAALSSHIHTLSSIHFHNALSSILSPILTSSFSSLDSIPIFHLSFCNSFNLLIQFNPFQFVSI